MNTKVLATAILLNLGAATAWAQEQQAEPAAPPPIEEKAIEQTPSAPAETPTLERFQSALSPYGRWVNTPEYGLVWVPSNVDAGWRPYTNGRWVYTESGWTFVSYDSWGWAPFHYGRWAYYPAYGWSWIPGYQWSPAWVSWRYGGDYMAWAPLGPVGVTVAYYNTPSLWIAVRGGDFYRPLVRSYFVPTVRIGNVFRTTYFAGLPRVGRYYSPPAAYVSRIVGQPIGRVSARAVAPYWAARGTYRPQHHVETALRSATIIARPTGAPVRPYVTPNHGRFTPAPRPIPRPIPRPGHVVNTPSQGYRAQPTRPAYASAPVYHAPAYRTPVYHAPAYRAPAAPPARTYAQPSRPSYSHAPAYRTPVYHAPAYRTPAAPPARTYAQPSRPSYSHAPTYRAPSTTVRNHRG
jgi:hypothetical protein